MNMGKLASKIKIRVYIASPYSIGDKLENVHRSMAAADRLIELGFVPYIPLLCHYQNELYPQSEFTWLTLSSEWLRQCDAVLRLEGESEGADIETSIADVKSIPVFYSIDSLVEHTELLTLTARWGRLYD